MITSLQRRLAALEQQQDAQGRGAAVVVYAPGETPEAALARHGMDPQSYATLVFLPENGRDSQRSAVASLRACSC